MFRKTFAYFLIVLFSGLVYAQSVFEEHWCDGNWTANPTWYEYDNYGNFAINSSWGYLAVPSLEGWSGNIGTDYTALYTPLDCGTAFTADFWVHKRTPTFSCFIIGFSQGVYSSAAPRFRVFINHNNMTMNWEMRIYDVNDVLLYNQVIQYDCSRWYNLHMTRADGGDWEIIWDYNGAYQTTAYVSDSFASFDDPYLFVTPVGYYSITGGFYLDDIVITPNETNHWSVDDNTLALWWFNEGSGNIAYDQTTNNYDLHLNNLAGWSPGQIAFLPQGAGTGPDNYYIGDNLDEITIEAYVRLNNPLVGNHLIIDRYDYYTSASYYLFIGAEAGNGGIDGMIKSTNGDNHVLTEDSLITDNELHHIALTWRSEGETQIWLDGELVASAPSVGGTVRAGGDPLRTGYNSLTGYYCPFNGYIDEMRISDIVRYGLQTYPGEFIVDEHTAGLWHFNEGIGNIAHDCSCNNYNLNLADGAGWQIPGWNNTPAAVVLNITANDTGQKVISSHLIGNGWDELTIDAYFYPTVIGPYTGWVDGNPIVSRNRWWSISDPSYYLILGSHGELYAGVYLNPTGSNVCSQIVTEDSIITAGQWYHAAVTWSSGEPTRLWLNNQLIAEATQAPTGTIRAGNDGLYIGCNCNEGYGYGWEYFHGYIDEVRISDTVRYEAITPPALTVTYPNGGEVWHIGDTPTITWTHDAGFNSFDVLLSRNNGVSWETLDTGLYGFAIDWTWNAGVTPPTSNACLVKIVGHYGTSQTCDVSNAVFTITDDAPFIPDQFTEALWHFDEAPGTFIAFDASGNGYNMSLQDGAQFTPAGHFNGAVDLTDPDAKVASVYQIGNGWTAITIDAYIYATQINSQHPIVSRTDFWNIDAVSYYFEVRQNGVIAGGVWCNEVGTQSADAVSGPGIIQTNQWYHVALTWSSGQPARIFVDNMTTPVAQSIDAPVGYIRYSTDPLMIGCNWYQIYGWFYWQGKIDEVRISDIDRYPQVQGPEFPLDANTAALYHFNENSGFIAHDATANHYDLNLEDGASWISPGWANTPSAADLTDPDAKLNSNHLVGNGWDEITLDAHIYLTSMDYSPIILRYEWYWPGDPSYYLYASETGYLCGGVYLGAPGTNQYSEASTAPGAITINQWYHVAMTWSSGQPLRLFINGILSASSTDAEVGNIRIGQDPLRVGCQWDEGYGWFYFNGYIDEVRISDMVRYGPEENFAVDFDGSTGYGQIPNNPTLNFGTGNFTWEAFFKLESWPTDYDPPVLTKAYIPNQEYICIQLSLASHQIIWDGRGGGIEWTVVSGEQVILGDWYHVAGVRYGNNFILYVFHEANPVSIYSINLPNVGSPDNLGGLTVGNRGISGYNNRWFPGVIDEVRIWNDARTLEEIEQYNWVELAGNEPNLVAYYDFNEGAGNTFEDKSPNSNNGTLYGGFQWIPTNWLPISDIVVTLTPHNPPIQIPAGGGSFQFDISMTNNSPITYIIDAWTTVTLHNGVEFSVLTRDNIALPSGWIMAKNNLTQFVPNSAPQGIYHYNAYLKDHNTWALLAQDSFQFEKLAGDGPPNHNYGWACLGWDEEDMSISTLPTKFALHPPSPNPFNPQAELTFDLPEAGLVKLVIYDITGREVAVLQNGTLQPGTYHRVFEGAELASGVYFAHLKVGNFQQTQKLALIK